MAHLVNVHVETFTFANQVLDSLLHLMIVQELSDLLSQLVLLLIFALVVVASSRDAGVDLVHLVVIV